VTLPDPGVTTPPTDEQTWTEDDHTTALDLVYAWLGADRAARNWLAQPGYIVLTQNIASAISEAFDNGYAAGRAAADGRMA